MNTNELGVDWPQDFHTPQERLDPYKHCVGLRFEHENRIMEARELLERNGYKVVKNGKD